MIEQMSLPLSEDRTRAFESWWQENRAWVWHTLFRRVQNREVANDLLQETALRAWQGYGQFRGQHAASMSAWVRRISTHVVGQHYRNLPPLACSLDCPSALKQCAEQEADPEAKALAAEYSTEVQEALDSLSELQRDLVRMFYRDNLTYREIADQTGLTIGTISSTLHRARQMLETNRALAAYLGVKPSRQEAPRSNPAPLVALLALGWVWLASYLAGNTVGSPSAPWGSPSVRPLLASYQVIAHPERYLLAGRYDIETQFRPPLGFALLYRL